MISIITPFARPDAGFLLDAYVSFSRSTLPFEWLIQEDGPDPVGVPQELLADPRVSYRPNNVHLAAGWDWNVFTELSSSFAVKSSWLTTSDDVGGWERAAHCVGYILGIRGVYTRCPEPSLRASAREVVRTAAVVAFGGQ